MSSLLSSPDARGEGRGVVPSAVRAGVALVLVEAAVLVAAALWLLLSVVRGAASSASAGVGVGLFALAMAAILVLAARAVTAGRRGGRAPVLTWQLLQAATAASLLGAGPPVATAAGGALAVAVLVAVLLLGPSTARHLGPRPA